MKKLSILLILGSAQVLTAGYNQGYNNGYQGNQGYQGQGYYQQQPTQYEQAPRNPNDWSQQEQKQYSNPNQVNTSNWDNGVADDEINRKVKEVLAPGLTSEIRLGIITLRGNVDSIENKSKADEAVRKIAGVKGINNQIVVGTAAKTEAVKDVDSKYPQDQAATAEDRVLNAKIRDKLKGGLFSKGFDAVILRTSNGIVLITGSVDTNDDVVKVHDQVKAVDGVKDVNNQLTVKNK